MAQARPASALQDGNAPEMKLSEKALFEIQQYQKILRLCDTILAGKHPSVKPSSDAAQKKQKPSAGGSVGGSPSRASEPIAVLPTPSSLGKPELNPIFLEKSDELVRAELQIQRQRLERSIKEEYDQRRATKASQAEAYSDLDLSDVLAQALVLVQASAAPAVGNDSLAANVEASSDSFDDSTFYSSHHDTPESHLTSRIPNQTDDSQVSTGKPARESGSTQAGQQLSVPTPITILEARINQGSSHGVRGAAPAAAFSIVPPGLNNYVQSAALSSGPTQPPSVIPSRSDVPGNWLVGSARTDLPSNRTRLPDDTYHDSHPPSPLVRNHTLQPVAPQPTHPSSLVALAVSTQSHEALGRHSNVGTPAQVTALRSEGNTMTSPESSSAGGQRKGKKKKRKADRAAAEGDAPYIKPEPRSPSPLSGSSYIRPNKKQRHAHDASIMSEHVGRAELQGVQYVAGPYREAPLPVGYATGTTYTQRPYSTAVGESMAHRSGEYYDGRRIAIDDRGTLQQQPIASPAPYSTSVAHPPRPASQLVSDPYRSPARPYREYQEGGRFSINPGAQAFASVPRPPTTSRIVVDSLGREYIEPTYPPSHLSAVPAVRHGEPELVYERLPPRAMSRQPAPGAYEEGGVVYGGPAPAYHMPRRIITQPEYSTHDYRDIHHGDFSSRPIQTQGQFVQVLAPQDRRYVDGGYVETVHQEAPPEYNRVYSVRPEALGPAYRASAYPESRREVHQPYMREFSSRPLQEPPMQRRFTTGPGERPTGNHDRVPEEVSYVDRPHGSAQEVIYADDDRRNMYR